MTASELMAQLSKLPPDAPLVAWSPETEQYEPVVEVVWNLDGSELIVRTIEDEK
jgi:hypothetical protein